MGWATGHKYGAKKTEYDGQVYPSRAEAHYAAALDLSVAAGVLRSWCRPAPVVLLDAPRARDRITYQPDFHCVTPDGSEYWVDVKGVLTPVFRLKQKLWKARFPDRDLRVVEAA